MLETLALLKVRRLSLPHSDTALVIRIAKILTVDNRNTRMEQNKTSLASVLQLSMRLVQFWSFQLCSCSTLPNIGKSQ